LLFLHPASGGHGLNLQYGSHTMVIFSASFSYEQMSQTKARIDRQGQEFPVVFHFLKSLDTVDELVLQVLEAKAQGMATVLSLVKEYANARRKN
jgi:SNF2 family DNA or RNA helicase